MPKKDAFDKLPPVKAAPKPPSLAEFKNPDAAPPPEISNTAPPARTPAKPKPRKKPKPEKERESEMLGLMLTPTEKAALAKKAGLVGVSTFLKHFLRTETDLLK